MFQEEEDEYNDSDTDDDEAQNRSKEARNQSLFNKRWRQAIVKDLTRQNTGDGGQLTRSDSLDQVLRGQGDNSEVKLSLREVGHIRRVLARAELEASIIEPEVKQEVEAGRVCGVCHAQRLGGGVIRGRGVACELCRVMACSGCVEVTARVSRDTEYHIQDIPRHLLAPEAADLEATEDAGTRHNCAGSAPSSPRASRRSGEDTGHMSPPLQPPRVTSRTTLPRRWSMVTWPRRTQAEEDGVTVCLHCKSMVKQVTTTVKKSWSNNITCVFVIYPLCEVFVSSVNYCKGTLLLFVLPARLSELSGEEECEDLGKSWGRDT